MEFQRLQFYLFRNDRVKSAVFCLKLFYRWVWCWLGELKKHFVGYL